MPEPFQVFSFGMAVPDLKIVGQSGPQEQEPTMPVVITPTEAEQSRSAEAVAPDPEVRDGVARPPRRRPENSEQRKKP